MHWVWGVAAKTLGVLKPDDIQEFIAFCKNPPLSWIGVHKVPRFIQKADLRVPNPDWRPFVVTLSKTAHRQGERPNPKQFELSQGAIKETFAILSTFYTYLQQEEYVYMNPVALIRQKSKFIRKQQGAPKIRRLSELQWNTLIITAKKMAEADPKVHERTLFILTALYSMYLRISELAASERWVPMMKHFFRDGDGNWWFSTVGKGNKERQIAVSNAMLEALKRWRNHLGLTPLPTLADNHHLLAKTKGKGPIASTNYIRMIVQGCFDKAIETLKAEGHIEESEALLEATVHWLRHTGISDDVKHRPREHVRDDAGHSSSATTDKYIDIELRERHLSAKHKQLSDED
jgi:integrase